MIRRKCNWRQERSRADGTLVAGFRSGRRTSPGYPLPSRKWLALTTWTPRVPRWSSTEAKPSSYSSSLCGVILRSKRPRQPLSMGLRDRYLRTSRRALTRLSELDRRFDVLRQFPLELSRDLNRRSGFVVVGYLCSPANYVLHPSGSTDGVVKVP